MNRVKLLWSAALMLSTVTVHLTAAATALTAQQKAEQAAQQSAQATALIPENERGDIHKLTSSMFGLYRVEDVDQTKEFCAPSGSAFRIGPTQPNGLVSLTITALPTKTKDEKDLYDEKGDLIDAQAKRLCKKADSTDVDWVDSHFKYMATAIDIASSDAYKTGVTFGALVVPFKYYIGDDAKFSASSTVAPYLGFTFGNRWGMNMSFLLSAGLGLTPINDSQGETETKPALSTAMGLLLTSQKNSRWSSGIVVGKDFVSDADRDRDPVSDDAWISVFVGAELK
ncbi:hypothetical protein [Sinimarinibacterium flocculans]|uniref:hypothetical protein n=1 Tax=Sinimarinibacterium flocculans TaxID=985250 RepID=UPI00351567C9